MIMDEVVGNITAAYKAKGMWENTLVVMSSEHKLFPHSLISREISERLLVSTGATMEGL